MVQQWYVFLNGWRIEANLAYEEISPHRDLLYARLGLQGAGGGVEPHVAQELADDLQQQ